jgi:tRNA(Ile)-lysidine synthase TilS/MesJ
MYSGGLDSLGALYRLLTDAKYENFGLHIHHLNLRNRENRVLAEHKAIKSTLAYFRNSRYRNFLYTESSHDYSFMRKYFTFDTYWYAFMAANIITADNAIRHVAVGRTKTDIESAASMNHAKRGHEIFHATLALDKRFTRSYIYPVAHMTKKQIWEMLPADLRELSWSCRRPVNQDGGAQPCGKCRTCKEMAEIKTAAQAAGQ